MGCGISHDFAVGVDGVGAPPRSAASAAGRPTAAAPLPTVALPASPAPPPAPRAPPSSDVGRSPDAISTTPSQRASTAQAGGGAPGGGDESLAGATAAVDTAPLDAVDASPVPSDGTSLDVTVGTGGRPGGDDAPAPAPDIPTPVVRHASVTSVTLIPRPPAELVSAGDAPSPATPAVAYYRPRSARGVADSPSAIPTSAAAQRMLAAIVPRPGSAGSSRALATAVPSPAAPAPRVGADGGGADVSTAAGVVPVELAAAAGAPEAPAPGVETPGPPSTPRGHGGALSVAGGDAAGAASPLPSPDGLVTPRAGRTPGGGAPSRSARRTTASKPRSPPQHRGGRSSTGSSSRGGGLAAAMLGADMARRPEP